jgi:hypothetical protein
MTMSVTSHHHDPPRPESKGAVEQMRMPVRASDACALRGLHKQSSELSGLSVVPLNNK